MDANRLKEYKIFLRNGEYEEAFLRAKKLVSSYTDDDVFLNIVGELAIKCNDFVAGECYFGQACSINPNNTAAIAGQLLCSIALNRTAEQEILLERIWADSTDRAIIAKSIFYKSKNNLKKELEVLNEGYDLYPRNIEIIEKLVDVKSRNCAEDPSIMRLIEYGLMIEPSNELLMEQKLMYLYRNESYEECIKLCKQILRNFPNKAISQSAQVIRRKINDNANMQETQSKFKGYSDESKRNISNEDKSGSLTIEQALSELDQLIGLDAVKKQVYSIKKKLEYDKMRTEILGIPKVENEENYHFVFLGNPGTGKTTVARLMGSIFKAYGILEKGQLIEASRVNLVSQYVGGTAIKTQEVVDEALGGVLFIDEAYSLVNGDNDSAGREALDTLVKNIEDHRTEFIVILAGYRKEMEDLLKQNSGLRSRFRKIIDFPDYSDEELYEIACLEGAKQNYTFTPEGRIAFIEKINKMKVDDTFGNARTVRNLISDAIAEKAQNYNSQTDGAEYLTKFRPRDFGIDVLLNPEDKVKASLNELHNLQGLKSVKSEVETMIAIAGYLKNSSEDNVINTGELPVNLNMAFIGNPGTGKTTVARIYAELLAGLGLLKNGNFIEAGRNELVGKYQGATAEKTKRICESAYGGVLFIDEAYALVNGSQDDFGHEAISTLLTEMENNRDKMVVIFAGYSREMEAFMDENSGLKSRIGKTIIFDDYNAEELCAIFNTLCLNDGIKVDEEAKKVINNRIQFMYENKDCHFGNAREIRNLYEEIWKNMVKRVMKNKLTGINRSTFTCEDVVID